MYIGFNKVFRMAKKRCVNIAAIKTLGAKKILQINDYLARKILSIYFTPYLINVNLNLDIFDHSD